MFGPIRIAPSKRQQFLQFFGLLPNPPLYFGLGTGMIPSIMAELKIVLTVSSTTLAISTPWTLTGRWLNRRLQGTHPKHLVMEGSREVPKHPAVAVDPLCITALSQYGLALSEHGHSLRIIIHGLELLKSYSSCSAKKVAPTTTSAT